MEKKTNEALKKLLNIYGNDTDFLIIAHNNGKCSSVLHGDRDNIAQAIFACMHGPDSPIANDLYRMLRLLVMNILNSPSPYAANLAETIVNMIPGEGTNEKEDDKDEK